MAGGDDRLSRLGEAIANSFGVFGQGVKEYGFERGRQDFQERQRRAAEKAAMEQMARQFEYNKQLEAIRASRSGGGGMSMEDKIALAEAMARIEADKQNQIRNQEAKRRAEEALQRFADENFMDLETARKIRSGELIYNPESDPDNAGWLGKFFGTGGVDRFIPPPKKEEQPAARSQQTLSLTDLINPPGTQRGTLPPSGVVPKYQYKIR